METLTYEFRIDAVPETWQFLNGLRRDDLIAELIQNDLDAGATKTRIAFEQDQMVCEGNGAPIDDEGWERLSYFRGAGDAVPCKRRMIGVKNHGLNAGFTLGDSVIVRSAGKCLIRTVRVPERAPRPYPGTTTALLDEAAPRIGCRIEIPYRDKPLRVDVGEKLTFPAIEEEHVESLFQAATDELPLRFLGVVRPTKRQHFEIELSHWRLGAYTFRYSCQLDRAKQKGRFFFRRCVRTAADQSREVFREQVCSRRLPLSAANGREVPDFYREGSGFFVEVAWPIDRRGKPAQQLGHLRYPIAYVGEGARQSTGIGASYSAPFISDSERHGISQQTGSINQELIDRCDELVVDALKERVLPVQGPAALSIVSNGSDVERLNAFTKLLLTKRAIPIVRPGTTQIATTLLSKRRNVDARWSFVIPAFTAQPGEISPILKELCPADFPQLDPRTPPNLIRTLVRDRYETGAVFNNLTSPYTVFDENDLLGLLTGDAVSNADFPPSEQWTARNVVEPSRSRILDALYELERDGTDDRLLSDEMLQKVRTTLELHDTQGKRVPLKELFATRDQFEPPPWSHPPHIIHAELNRHQLFSLKRWKLPRCRLEDMIDTSEADRIHDQEQVKGWRWLQANWNLVSHKIRNLLAEFPIWHTRDGRYVSVADFCYPKSSKIRTILKSVLCLPTKDVLRLLIRRGHRSDLFIRQVPTPEELERWMHSRCDTFEIGKRLRGRELDRFDNYETVLHALSRDPRILKNLKSLADTLVSLSMEGTLRRCDELHLDTTEVRDVELLPQDRLRLASAFLGRLSSVRRKPSRAALLRAMQDPLRERGVWLHRLEAFVRADETGDAITQLGDVACVPEADEWLRPCDVAIPSPKGDFWGEWKTRLSAKLNQEQQRVLVEAGATPPEPNAISSRQFFVWLSTLVPQQLERQIPAVLRQLQHPQGVALWRHAHPQIKCIPVRGRDGIELLSERDCVRSQGTLFIDDYPPLGTKLEAASANVHLLVDNVKGLTLSVIDSVRDLPFRRLSEVARFPQKSMGSTCERSRRMQEELQRMQSPAFVKEMPRRLAYFGVPKETLRSHWSHLLKSLHTVSICKKVFASYSLGRRSYSVEAPAAINKGAGVIYLTKESLSLLLDTISGHICTEGASKMERAALEKAIQMELPDAFKLGGGEFQEADTRDSESQQSAENRPIRATHGRGASLSGRNLPRDLPLTEEPSANGNRHSRPKTTISRGRPQDVIEKSHIERLKETYAWHCQVCLSADQPQELAPPRSYGAHFINRRKLIDAHHPDQVHTDGARHGANLLILCSMHHEELGDHIPRAAINEAIRKRCKKRIVRYADEKGATKSVHGVVVLVHLPDRPKALPVFFAPSHYNYWLRKIDEELEGAAR